MLPAITHINAFFNLAELGDYVMCVATYVIGMYTACVSISDYAVNMDLQ